MSRHRFLKNMTDDDYEDFDKDLEEEEDRGDLDFDGEVYDVYDEVVDSLPNVSYEEIEEVLINLDYDVDETIKHFLSKAKKSNKKKTAPTNTPTGKKVVNNNNNKNNNGYIPSTLAIDLCKKFHNEKETIVIDDKEFTFQSLYKNNNNSNDNIDESPIIPFDFKSPSPDDIILNRQKQAFKPNHHSASTVINNSDPININTVNANLNTLSINNNNKNQNNNNNNKKDAKTPYNTPIGTPINDKNIPSSPVDTIDPNLLASTINSTVVNSNKNLNVKQHNDSRKKELETMVHTAFSSEDNKPLLNMVVIGHVDAGKSTTMGHLLYLLGYVDKRTLAKFEHESNRMGKSSFHFAWVLDEHDEERERGVTMDVCVRYFETKHRRITLLDAPGHRDFIPNMISGTTQADVAVLLINASEFEAGFGAEGQTKEHALLAKSLGIMQLIVAINKMDVVGWSKERYDYIVESIKLFLVSAKFNEKNIRFVPISGFSGENLLELKEEKLKQWYKGPTLVDFIDSFSVGERLINKPLRMNVNDIYKSSSKGHVAVGGKVEAGIIGVGDKVLIAPGNEICTVKSIRRSNMESDWAVGGDNVDLGLLVENTQILRVGSILCDPEKPIPLSKKFMAQIVTFTLPIPMTNGFQCVFHCHQMEEPCTVTKLNSLLDSNGGVSKKNPRCISDTATAVIEITLNRLSCLELYSSYRQLGRFTLRESGKTIAAGLITEFLDLKSSLSSSTSSTSSLSTSTSSTNNFKS
ncbi:hypothetical protein CYY_006739 [Polysphondylium violaceum]|uniref:Tr-type G domain-containing protein n=1 Tax=Polysphondylium violaceum TaxID=133409 RepID=A0A8J4PS16_9MYCE|nr:hypothetical protein CYY_006739 [Polysphondylium violaceum]